MNKIIPSVKKLLSQSMQPMALFLLAAAQCLVACQSTPKNETPRQQASDLFHEAEGSGTIVLVVIALIVAWIILLGFVGRITKIKSS